MNASLQNRSGANRPIVAAIFLGVLGYSAFFLINAAVSFVFGIALNGAPIWLNHLIVVPVTMELMRIAFLLALLNYCEKDSRPIRFLVAYTVGWVLIDLVWAIVNLSGPVSDGAIAAAAVIRAVQPISVHLISALVAFWLLVRFRVQVPAVFVAMAVIHIVFNAALLARGYLVQPAIYPDQVLTLLYLVAAGILLREAASRDAPTWKT